MCYDAIMLRVFLSGAALLLTCLSAFGAAARFTASRNYPNIGLKLPGLDSARADPVPMPQAQAFLSVRGTVLSREDRFQPFELWYGNQCCAQWRDAAGNRLVLGRATHRLPVFEEETVPRERFEQAMQDGSGSEGFRDRAALNEWVATFADTPVYDPEPLRLNAFSLDEVLFYPCGEADKLVYAILPRRQGSAERPDWFCVTFHAPGASDPDALREHFEEAFLSQISQPSRTEVDQGPQAEELDVRSAKGARPPDLPDHPVRREARKSVENYGDWWFAETEGTIILSDADTDLGKRLIQTLQETLPPLWKAFAQLVPPLTRDRDVALLRLFQRRADYARYTGPAYAWTGGMWMPGRRELVLPLEADPQVVLRTVRHESFHQYLSFAYGMVPAAPWFNEGHACLFENARMDAEGRVILDEDTDRVFVLLDHLDTVLTLLPHLLHASYEEFYAGFSAGRRLKYAMAWGLVYYLQKGAPTERNTPFKQILPTYADALALELDGAKATEAAFADVDMAVFLDTFREFWLKRRGTAMRYDPLQQR
jgi:hypothetical protein